MDYLRPQREEGGLIWVQAKTGVISTQKAQDEVLAILPLYIRVKGHLLVVRLVSTGKWLLNFDLIMVDIARKVWNYSTNMGLSIISLKLIPMVFVSVISQIICNVQSVAEQAKRGFQNLGQRKIFDVQANTFQVLKVIAIFLMERKYLAYIKG